MIATTLPPWGRERLEKVASARASELALARRHYEPVVAPVETLVVNMLRHEYTTYDEDPSEQAHKGACTAIAVTFPWLADECERQVRRRHDREVEGTEALRMLDEGQEAAQAWRSERVVQSRAAMDRLALGMAVRATVRGRARVARVVKLGRSRVTVEFAIKSGAQRSALVYARDVVPE